MFRNEFHDFFHCKLVTEIHVIVVLIVKVSKELVVFGKLEQSLHVESEPEVEDRRIDLPVFYRIEGVGELLEE